MLHLQGGIVAFVGQNDAGLGIYKWSRVAGVSRVVQVGDTAPGGFVFGAFPQPPSVRDGELVFRAYLEGGDTGLFHIDMKGPFQL